MRYLSSSVASFWAKTERISRPTLHPRGLSPLFFKLVVIKGVLRFADVTAPLAVGSWCPMVSGNGCPAQRFRPSTGLLRSSRSAASSRSKKVGTVGGLPPKPWTPWRLALRQPEEAQSACCMDHGGREDERDRVDEIHRNPLIVARQSSSCPRFCPLEPRPLLLIAPCDVYLYSAVRGDPRID